MKHLFLVIALLYSTQQAFSQTYRGYKTLTSSHEIFDSSENWLITSNYKMKAGDLDGDGITEIVKVAQISPVSTIKIYVTSSQGYEYSNPDDLASQYRNISETKLLKYPTSNFELTNIGELLDIAILDTHIYVLSEMNNILKLTKVTVIAASTNPNIKLFTGSSQALVLTDEIANSIDSIDFLSFLGGELFSNNGKQLTILTKRNMEIDILYLDYSTTPITKYKESTNINSDYFVGAEIGDFDNYNHDDIAILTEAQNGHAQITLYSYDNAILLKSKVFDNSGFDFKNDVKAITSGDFDGDGESQLAIVYQYGNYLNVETSIFVSNTVDGYINEGRDKIDMWFEKKIFTTSELLYRNNFGLLGIAGGNFDNDILDRDDILILRDNDQKGRIELIGYTSYPEGEKYLTKDGSDEFFVRGMYDVILDHIKDDNLKHSNLLIPYRATYSSESTGNNNDYSIDSVFEHFEEYVSEAGFDRKVLLDVKGHIFYSANGIDSNDIINFYDAMGTKMKDPNSYISQAKNHTFTKDAFGYYLADEPSSMFKGADDGLINGTRGGVPVMSPKSMTNTVLKNHRDYINPMNTKKNIVTFYANKAVEYYKDSYDIAAYDNYPYNYHPIDDKASRLANRKSSARISYNVEEVFSSIVKNNKEAFWFVAQNEDNKDFGKIAPPYTAKRYMTYLPIIQGATGLVYYGYSNYALNDSSYNQNNTLKKDAGSILTELAQLDNYLTSERTDYLISTDKDNYLYVDGYDNNNNCIVDFKQDGTRSKYHKFINTAYFKNNDNSYLLIITNNNPRKSVNVDISFFKNSTQTNVNITEIKSSVNNELQLVSLDLPSTIAVRFRRFSTTVDKVGVKMFIIGDTVPFIASPQGANKQRVSSLPSENDIINNDAINSIYPNPFNPTTTINFSVSQSNSKVLINVYNITGAKVATIANGNYTAGSYQVSFNGENLSSGIYFVRSTINNKVFNNKMTLIK